MAATQQTYNSDQTKWEAYQFSDPFAANSFLCCNRKLKVVCRPNCDYLPKVSAKDDVEFSTDVDSSLRQGYKLCGHCDITDPNTQLDLPLVKLTIESINYSIGFTNDGNEIKRRAYSLPSVSNRKLSDGSNERQLTRNESEHIKLVELACRHIAAAASLSIRKQDVESGKGSKKRRRGGVLGFKELASKSKLSPWHFHRVFKSITGLTPKSYGDHCWKFIKDRERPQLATRRSHFKPSSEVSSNFQSSSSSASKRSQEIYVAPHVAVASTPSTNIDEFNQELSPFSGANETNNFQSNPMFNQSFLDSNKNSLDINVNFKPFRHHSLDLGVPDISDFNSTFANNLSPQYLANFDQMAQNSLISSISSGSSQLFNQSIPMPDANYVHSAFPSQSRPTEEVPPQQSLENFYDYDSNQVDQTLLQSKGADAMTQIDENQWPNVEASTPEQLASRILTPPSSIPDSELNMKGIMGNPEAVFDKNHKEMVNSDSFYDILRNSPWDDIEELDIQQNFGLINETNENNLNNVDTY